MKIYRVKEGIKRRLEVMDLCWIVASGFILLLIAIGVVVIKNTPSLSIADSENKVWDWMILSILAHKAYFIPGLLVPIIAIFLIGSPLGLLSSRIIVGYKVAWTINSLAILITDILESLPKYPTILLAILLIPKYYEHRLLWVMIILGILNASRISRIVKAKIDCLEKTDFIEAAKSFGISKWRLIIFHILISNCLSIFIIQAFFQMIDVILIEIGYTYIGSLAFPGRSSIPTFGNMLVVAKDNIDQWLWILPLSLVVFNILTFLNLARIVEKKFIRREIYEPGSIA